MRSVSRDSRWASRFAFTYVALHFLTWLVLDRGLDWNGIMADIAKRPFVTVGFAALLLLLLVPLTVTSTDRWMRRLGRRWRQRPRARAITTRATASPPS